MAAENSCAVSASFITESCARNTFSLEKYTPPASAVLTQTYDDEFLHYGQKVKMAGLSPLPSLSPLHSPPLLTPLLCPPSSLLFSPPLSSLLSPPSCPLSSLLSSLLPAPSSLLSPSSSLIPPDAASDQTPVPIQWW